MDLYEMVESTRFLGREWLLWLWWKSDLFDGEMSIGRYGDGAVWIDDSLTLELRGEAVEQSRMKGTAPAATPEAKEALRHGKMPTKARISLSLGDKDFSFVFEGETFALSGVRLPELLKDEWEERFYERMYLLEELDDLIAALYREFLDLRLSAAWDQTIVPAIRAWISNEETLAPDEYLRIIEGLAESSEEPDPAPDGADEPQPTDSEDAASSPEAHEGRDPDSTQ